MSLIVEITEIVGGPIKDLYLALTTGPLFQFPALPPINVQVGPETVGDLNLGSSFEDFGSSFDGMGSSFGDFGSSFGSSVVDFAPNLGSSNGDQNISGFEIPGSSIL